jgi:LAO/AO transport system kinase
VNDGLLDRALRGDFAAAARVLSAIESQEGLTSEHMDRIFRRGGRAAIVGITGTPGAGKSTLVAAMVALLRQQSRKVAVLAVDPSSPRTGGAVLGDRVRLGSLTQPQSGVFFRSMATRGQQGGLSFATPAAIRLLDAMGMDVILVETVGVGQNELAVAGAADLVILVVTPAQGDWVQVMKAGILEIADIVAVNKSDLPGAAVTRSEIYQGLRIGGKETAPEVVLTQAINGEGVDALVGHAKELVSKRRTSGMLEQRRLERLQSEAVERALWHFRREVVGRSRKWFADGLDRALSERMSDPASVGDMIVSRVLQELTEHHGAGTDSASCP